MSIASVIAVPFATRRRRRIIWIASSFVLLALAIAGLSLGDAAIPVPDVFAALFGRGEAGTRLIVVGWRLPRVVLGAAIGAMLALSGALFQVITRNPLGSPDILGFSAGAYTGALLVIIGGSVSTVALTAGAVGGGIASAALVFALVAWRGAGGTRLIIVGIALTAMLGAVNTMIELAADDVVAHTAAIWGAGSLNGIDGRWMPLILITFVLGGLAVAALAPGLTLYELGEDRATSLGVRPVRLRITAMLVGVVLLAVTIAAAGPIAFVALAAPQIARRVWRSGPMPFAASAMTGAVLLMFSDLLAARLFAPTMLPTGLVTIGIGGLYLAWMLSAANRRRR
ncbi:FecCD family ABC transporter permease [Microbacterium saperdae]|uniref:Iron complex transport system permease protein n=1 Tax=Microbacterium saperdae TaxID=69368 RepID=A0A543BQ84_9MICO|nr:iron chelate uptake ABC transporter family permease subunit [Microbacterium saperdae]TQL86989.1 iron complex transport system permease protein [Microbacterium saperdae]GGM43735.1 iron-enterobactin transporter permease [Microbacterium saperdae]